MKQNLSCSFFLAVLTACGAFFLSTSGVLSQCDPAIKIDGRMTEVNDKLHLPVWLSEGQELAIASSVQSISVIEFNANASALEFSRVLHVLEGNAESVPEGKVWKVESILVASNSSSYKSTTFSNPGTYTFIVPGCAEQICIEAWSAGGGGGGGVRSEVYSNGWKYSHGAGGGGGGGGFGAECFAVSPGASYTVTVGAGGTGGTGINSGSGGTAVSGSNGGSSSVGSLITVLGGNGGGGGFANTSSGTGGAGGTGGSSTALNNAPGTTGATGPILNQSPSYDTNYGGAGGAAGNGGAGGVPTVSTGQAGSASGGGGAGGGSGSGGGKGADGKVIISW